ncbi:MAG: amidohydrolase family protein [Limnochordia bacterium]|jgi:predicted TIM-barrel fold metal-dependent hydrolase
MIIDSHAHVGSCRVFGQRISEQDLLGAMDRYGIEASIVQPFPGDPDARKCHDDIAQLAAKYPGRIFGLMHMNPYLDGFEAEARRCIEELGFVGIKLHPCGHGVNPLQPVGERVFEIAAELGVPIMVHTGTGVPFALPSLCLPAAKKHPDLTIILAHAGYAIYTDEALVVASMADNIYLETSWGQIRAVEDFVKKVGSDRVLFGSDLVKNIPVELAKYQGAAISLEERAAGLGGNACRLFKLPLGE